MQEFDIRGKTTVTAEVKAQVDDSPLVPPSQQGLGAVDNLDAFTDSIDQAESAYKENTALMKEFGDMLPELLKNLKSMSDTLSKFNQNTPRNVPQGGGGRSGGGNADASMQQSVLNVANAGSSAVQSVANTNIAGALLNGLNNGANSFRNMGRAANSGGMDGLGSLLGGLGTGLLVGAALLKAGDTLANKYIDEMPTIYGTSRAFGVTSDSGALSIYQGLNSYNRGTGLRTGEFLDTVQTLRRQGLGNDAGSVSGAVDQSGRVAEVTGRWAYATGGDANRYAELAGYMGRYGGSKDVAGDFNYLVSAGKASGLNDTQIPEFLAGIQQVMEDGIAKGFTRSSKEVADTMLMFSKLSGGSEFWKGEQGAKTLQQINAGIGGATGLSKTEDILLYTAMDRAFSGANAKKTQLGKDLYDDKVGYVNNMMLLEQGLNSKNFDAIMGSLSVYGDDEQAKIEALRKMTGLNYTGAMRLYKLNQNGESKASDFDTTLKNVLQDPSNQNLETRNAESLNKIHEDVVVMSQSLADIKIAAQEKIGKGLDKLLDLLGLSQADKYMENAITDLDPSQKLWYDMNHAAYFDSDKLTLSQKMENMNALRDWNGQGQIKLPHKATGPYVAYSEYDDKLIDKIDATGNIRLTDNFDLSTLLDKQDKYTLLIKQLYGEQLAKTYGKDVDITKIVNELFNNENYSRQKKKVAESSDDRVITRSEQAQTLNILNQIASRLGYITVVEQK